MSSIGDLLSNGFSVPVINYFLEEWRTEMLSGLQCLLYTEEGGKLSDTIDMFYKLALIRLTFTATV